MYQNVIISYLYKAQHVSGDTSPIIRSLKLHWQPLVFHTWKVVGCVVGGRCQTQYVPGNVHQLHVQKPSTCFGRHTTHHQESKTALAASGFSEWWTLSGTYCAWQRPSATRPATFHVWKTRGYQCSFRLLMMGGVSPETCWALYKYGIIKFWYIFASCWIFLYKLHVI